MKNMNPDEMSKALAKASEKAPAASPASKMGKEEQIGFHKGSINTLVAERNELVKIIANVEAILKAHVDALKGLGVNLQ